MNSLLQSLFMTPELRKRLFQWKYESSFHPKEENCIPFQLQKLFAKLQLRNNLFTNTKDLTKSFQWSSHASFEQQDIQVKKNYSLKLIKILI